MVFPSLVVNEGLGTIARGLSYFLTLARERKVAIERHEILYVRILIGEEFLNNIYQAWRRR
jgi:hypothetical protein